MQGFVKGKMAFREGFEPPTDGLEDRIDLNRGDYIKQYYELSNKSRAQNFLNDLPEFYKKLPIKDLKKLLMHAETHLHKSIQAKEGSNAKTKSL